MADGKDDPRARESRRILERVSQEVDSSGFSTLGSATGAMRRRMEADTPAGVDPIEYWGTRIGRGLGLAITVALIVWLIAYVLGGI